MNYLAVMLKVERDFSAVVIRIPLEGEVLVATTCPPGSEHDRLCDWIRSRDEFVELMGHAYALMPDDGSVDE